MTRFGGFFIVNNLTHESNTDILITWLAAGCSRRGVTQGLDRSVRIPNRDTQPVSTTRKRERENSTVLRPPTKHAADILTEKKSKEWCS